MKLVLLTGLLILLSACASSQPRRNHGSNYTNNPRGDSMMNYGGTYTGSGYSW